MRFLRDRYGMSGVVGGAGIILILLFLNNAGVLSLSSTGVSVVWWLLSWPFMFAALLVAGTATATQMSPAWGMPLLLVSGVLNLVYLYGLGRLAGFIRGRIR
jgi:hypothetical protein